jgi:hypothetical protein
MSPTTRLAVLLGLAFSLVGPAAATTITVDTATAGWTVNVEGLTGATPYIVDSSVTITSTKDSTGTFLAGGTVGAFDGFWTTGLNFSLPSDATGTTLNFSGLTADDRALLYLNGTLIGSTGIFGPATGCMTLTDGGMCTNFSFANNNGSGSVNSGFILGGTNTLLAIVNNTGAGIPGTTQGFTAPGDNTRFGITGAVTYSVSAVPEPSSGVLLLLGGSVFLMAGKWRNRSKAIR